MHKNLKVLIYFHLKAAEFMKFSVFNFNCICDLRILRAIRDESVIVFDRSLEVVCGYSFLILTNLVLENTLRTISAQVTIKIPHF